MRNLKVERLQDVSARETIVYAVSSVNCGEPCVSARARLIVLLGIVLVPAVAYAVPYVSGYASVVIAAVLAVALIRAKPAHPAQELGLARPPRVWSALALGVGIGLGLLLLNRLFLTPLIDHITGSQRDLSAFDSLRGNPRALLAMLPPLWVSAGLCEEIVYRGYLISQIAMLFGMSRVSQVAAVLVAAALFALAHAYQGVSGMLVTGTLGVIFGAQFLQQRNLWANVAAHITGDTASLILITLNLDRRLDDWGRSIF